MTKPCCEHEVLNPRSKIHHAHNYQSHLFFLKLWIPRHLYDP